MFTLAASLICLGISDPNTTFKEEINILDAMVYEGYDYLLPEDFEVTNGLKKTLILQNITSVLILTFIALFFCTYCCVLRRRRYSRTFEKDRIKEQETYI